MANTLETSIIIVSYHTGAVLFRTLETLIDQDGIKEIILIDNGNPPAITKELKQLTQQYTNLSIYTDQGNIGFGAGCNLGASYATGKYLLFLNPDCLLLPDALNTAISLMKKNPEAWLSGCRHIYPSGELQCGNKRNLLSPSTAFAQVFRKITGNRSRFPSLNIIEKTSDNNAEYVPAVSGAFMLFTREYFDILEGFDEGYFFHVEDLDMCQRIADKKGKILYMPSVCAVHFRSSSDVSSFFIERQKMRGFLRYFRLHYNELGTLRTSILSTAVYSRFLLRSLIYLLLHKRKLQRQASARQKRRQLQQSILQQPTAEGNSAHLTPHKKHVLVTGTSNSIGLHIVRRLLAHDNHVHALCHRDIIHYHHDNLQWSHGNLATGHLPFLLAEKKKNSTIELLIHTAPIWLLPDNLEQFSAKGIKRIVCFSSTSVEGKLESNNNHEQHIVSRLLQAEEDVQQRCKILGITWTILRPTLIYGNGLDKNISTISRIIKKIGFFPVYKRSKGLRQPVHADDLAQAALTSLTAPDAANKIFSLCGDTPLTYRDMVNQIGNNLGKPHAARTIPLLPIWLDILAKLTGKTGFNGEMARRMNQDLTFDDSHAQKVLHHQPRPFLNNPKSDLALDSASKRT